MSPLYHLAFSSEDIGSARVALLPGDPGRVPRIADALDAPGREIAWKREYRTVLGSVGGQPVLVTSTGIGGPSASIAVEELAQLGVHTFVRVGTTGGIHDGVSIGDVVVTSGSVRLDGASRDYAPIEFPAVPHHEVLAALVEAARAREIPHHVGITASTDTFYPGQERLDSPSGAVLRRLRGLTEELRALKVLNFEMESATILTMCAAMGLRSGCVTGVVGHRGEAEEIRPEALEAGERHAIQVAVEATRRLVG